MHEVILYMKDVVPSKERKMGTSDGVLSYFIPECVFVGYSMNFLNRFNPAYPTYSEDVYEEYRGNIESDDDSGGRTGY